MRVSILLLATACASTQPPHLMKPGPVVNGPTSAARLQEHVERLQADVARLGVRSVPRAATFDAAVPVSQTEFDTLGHGGLVLILAISRDPAELPLRRAVRGGEELMLFGTVPDATMRALRFDGTVGGAAWAGLYYLPRVKSSAEPIAIDFAVHRQGFRVGAPSPDLFGALDDQSAGRLDPCALEAVARREYPDVEPLHSCP